MLDILYQDEYYVVINKPTGLLVHRTKVANDTDVFALQLLRDQIGVKVNPIHRLDRKTSGVLMFGLSKEATSAVQSLFTSKQIRKEYHAIVRGYITEDKIIDYALTNLKGKSQEAITSFESWQLSECPFKTTKFASSRYSLVKAYPRTGRMHQIRRHLNHMRHPIIGDRPHGCNKQNKYFLQEYGLTEMMLHAYKLSFVHPFSHEDISITAPYYDTFKRISSTLKFDLEAT